MGRKVQKLIKNQNVATIICHPSRAIPTAICPADLLNLPDQPLKINRSPATESDSWSKRKPSVLGLDFSHVPEGHWERLRGLPTKFDATWDSQFGEINITSHRILQEAGAQSVTWRRYQTGPKTR